MPEFLQHWLKSLPKDQRQELMEYFQSTEDVFEMVDLLDELPTQ